MPVSPTPRARFQRLPAAVQSALIATVAMVLFSVVPPAVRALMETMTAYQVVFVRAFVGTVAIGAFFAVTEPRKLQTRRPLFHAQRATFNFVGMVMWFWALNHVELAKGIAIHFTMPLFITILAVIFLRERVGPRRVAALIAGFGGILVILRPGVIGIGLPELAILGSAALYGAAVIFLKIVVREDSPLATTFYTNLFMGLWCVPFTIAYWEPLTAAHLLPILGLGVCGLFAPFLVAVALKRSDASLVGAFDFLRLPFTALFGFALFGEVPDEFVWLGAVIIFASTWYITARESRSTQPPSARVSG